MSERDHDTPTRRLVAERQGSPRTGQRLAPGESARRWNIGRDLAAGVLLLTALFLPWNLYFGIGIPNSRSGLFALLVLTTLLSLGSIAATYTGSWRLFGPRCNPALAGWLRLGLNVPYLLLVLGFVTFDVIQTVRYGGSVKVPGGVGPGAWLGIAGSLLSAQPVITGTAADDDRFARWLASVPIVGYASMVGAALSFAFNLYWRVRYALPGSHDSAGLGKENVAVIATAVVYGVAALAAILVTTRWIVQRSKPSRLINVAVGASTLAAGVVVWSLPIGREIDGFHGIAQNTSTAGVGFEGYGSWAAAAAIVGPLALLRTGRARSTDKSIWREAARKGLLVIAVWGVGSVVMRLTDLVDAVSLNYQFSRYDSLTLAGFDLLTAVLAVLLRINLTNSVPPGRLVSALCGVLFTLTISRVVLGVVLAPRFPSSAHIRGTENSVYGNNLAQQITSTFDVMLCGLALCVLAVVIVMDRRTRRSTKPRRRAPALGGKGIRTVPPAAPLPTDAKTTRLGAGGASEPPWAPQAQPQDATQQLATGPRIFRSADSRQQSGARTPQIYRAPGDTTQRFATRKPDEGHHRR